MRNPYQLKLFRFAGGFCIVAPAWGWDYDRPWMAPHVSGRSLDMAILQYQMGRNVDPAHKVTPSRNKREGRYVGHARQTAFRVGEGRKMDCGFPAVGSDHVGLLIGARISRPSGASMTKAIHSMRGRL